MRRTNLLLSLFLSLSIFISLIGFDQPKTAVAAPAIVSSTATQVSAGGNHSCALTSSGGVVCWGYNSGGQLGDGTRTQRNLPVAVSGLSSGVQSVVTGYSHSCALTTGGGVKCWGFNYYGQLGDGTGQTTATPVDVSGLTSNVVSIVAGGNHTCALTTGGGVKCWGYNNAGQLGDATNQNAFSPVEVSGLNSGVSGIGAGGQHSCASLATGGAKCWGSNSGGQLGNSSNSDSNTPVVVNTLSGQLTSLDGGEEHTCALTGTGGAFCWGRNDNGRLGDGTFADKTSPVQVSTLTSGVTSLSAGGQHSCAIVSGAAKCWGGNQHGQLGINSTSGKSTPTAVTALSSGVNKISAGDLHSCAMMDSGALSCWGYNFYGQLGDGTSALYFSPVTVVGLSSGISSASAGDSHTCALTSTGGVKCWGSNGVGQLGNNSNTPSNLPVDVSGLASGIGAVSAGVSHTCALTTGGGVKCWGYNASGQLGTGNTQNSKVPVDVSGLGSGISKISAGAEHTCAVTNGGGVKCWGLNNEGQLGNGNTSNSNTPIDVSGLPGTVTAIGAGYLHTCALTSTGGVYCWGDNATGQLGNGTTNDSLAPVVVTGLGSGVIDLAVGWDHACAILTGGGVKCWGKNYSGQSGVAGGGIKTTPVDVTDLTSGASSLDGGAGHTCAIVNGGLKCWGSNTDGALGDGTGQSNHAPVDVSGLSSGVQQVSAGGSQTCAVVNPSELKCWGSSDDGEVGTGIPIERLVPVNVSGYSPILPIFLPLVGKGS